MKNVKTFENAIAYIHGRIEAQLEGFASSIGIPPRELTVRMATLLLSSQSGEILGAADSMPSLRGKTAKRGEAVESVEVAGGSHRKSPRKYRKVRKYIKAKKVKIQSSAQKGYWAKLSPQERSAEMQRRLLVAENNRQQRRLHEESVSV